MKRIFTLFFLAVLSTAASAQVFWTESFNNGCTSLCTTYSGPNGAWVFASSGPATACGAATTPNIWRISCAENGNAVGNCRTNCSTSNATLHVGNDPGSPSAGIFCPSGDCGAEYDAGGYCDILATPPSVVTDITAQSPVINCTGKSNITISFKYLEGGDGTNDDATLWYYDGSSWSQINPIAKSNCWASLSMTLPASANNNANVKIRFRWVNDDDGSGNDPSFAVDDIQLSVVGGGPPPVAHFQSSDSSLCANDCVTFTDLSTNSPTSWLWTFQGGTPSSSTDQNPYVCYLNAGTFSVKLKVTNGGGSDSLTTNSFINVLASPPAPTVTKSNDTLYSSTDPSYTSYQWYNGASLIPGATHSYVVITQGGNYNVKVINENGCATATGINVGIHDYVFDQHVELYPNPANNNLTIKGSWQTGTGLLSVYDGLGRKTKETIVKLEKQVMLNVEDLSRGIYFLQVVDDHGRWVGRFVKE